MYKKHIYQDKSFTKKRKIQEKIPENHKLPQLQSNTVQQPSTIAVDLELINRKIS